MQPVKRLIDVLSVTALVRRAVELLLKNLLVENCETSSKTCEQVVNELEDIYFATALVFSMKRALNEWHPSLKSGSHQKTSGLAKGILMLVRDLLHQLPAVNSNAKANISHTNCTCMEKLLVMWRLVHL